MTVPLRLAVVVAFAAVLAACGGSRTASTLPPAGGSGAGASSPERLVQIDARTAIDPASGVVLHGAVTAPARRAVDAARDLDGGLAPASPTPSPTPTPVINLSYYGGPVQTAPKAYMVFWGAQWSNAAGTGAGPGDPDGVKPFVKNVQSALAGSAWLNDVLQYTQTGGTPTGNPKNNRAGSWVDNATTLAGVMTSTATQTEALNAANHFGVAGVNVQIIIFLPTGIGAYNYIGNPSPGNWCGYHSWVRNAQLVVVPYIVIPYAPDVDWECGANYFADATPPTSDPYGVLDGVSFLLGHEIAETMTDPEIHFGFASTAWDDANNEEIGDKCEWLDNALNPDAGGYPVQSLWNNVRTSCRMHRGGT